MTRQRNDFNPRPRKEGDWYRRQEIVSAKLFQSTPSQRGRRSYSVSCDTHDLFQSTPSQRGRHKSASSCHARLLFQSTPSQRGRQIIAFRISVPNVISIHALAKRATYTPSVLAFMLITISIHALAKRAT